MNAFGFNSYGPPTVLETLKVPQPELKANQVLLKNLGFGLNPYDTALRAGDHLADRALNFPFIPGSDAVGQVIQIGTEVDDQLINQVVIAHPFSGGYGEELAISAKKLISKPESMSLAEAAGFSTVATIAYHALITTAQIKKGETLIIQGASGSVGSLAAQIAKANGLYVIGIGNSRNRQMMIDLGIDEVVAYDQADVAQVLAKRGDVVLDASLQGRASHVGLRILKDKGRYLFLNQAPDLINTATLLPIVYGEDLPALSYLCNLYVNGQLKLPETISHKATLENLIAGHQALLTKKERGKLVFFYE